MINCTYQSRVGEQDVCRVVADLIDRPLAECHVNKSACGHCLASGTAPQSPNAATASMAVGVAMRSQDQAFAIRTVERFRKVLTAPPAPTACVLRGPEIRKVDCKPCQADSLVPVSVPVFRCPRHSECTLNNTGTFPKIKACSTCGERLEQYVQLDVKPAPPEVMAAIHARAGNAPCLGNPHAK